MKRILLRLFNLFNSFITQIYACVVVLIFLVVVLIDGNLRYETVLQSYLPNWFLLLTGVGLLIVLIRRYHKRFQLRWTNRQVLVILLILSFALMMIQFFFVYSYYFYTGWDAMAVRGAAFLFIEHPHRIPQEFWQYFSYHVNQILITIVFGNAFRYFHQLGITNVYLSTLILNVLSVNLSGLLISLSMMKLTQSKTLGLTTWLFFFLLFQMSPWVSIPYTDTFGMFLGSIVFSIYVYNLDKRNPIFWYLIGFVSMIGYYIKPQVLIVTIAVVLFEILRYLSTTVKLRWYYVIISGALLYASFHHAIDYNVRLSYTYDFGVIYGRAFTYTHYIMTGLNPERYGIFLDSDAAISYQFGTIEEREAANWAVIRKRLEDYGVLGYIDFFTRKLLINFNDGTFAWFGEGGFVVEAFNDKTLLSPLLKEIYYEEGSLYRYFQTLSQFIWLLTLFLMTFIIKDLKKLRLEYTLLFLILIGSFLFIQIFEARARYLIVSLPYFAALASVGMHHFYTYITERNNHKKTS
jgi:hypothetical protein